MAKSCRKVFAVLGAICLASHVLSVQALYDASSSVKVLNAAKLSKALDTRGVLLVEFFAPWCGHCKNLKPEWETAATALNGMLTVAAVDVDSEKDLGAEYKIQGFPTIKLLVSRGQGKPARAVEYKGGRTAAEIVSWAMQQAAKVADKRLGGGDGASGGPKQRASARASANAKAGQAPEEPGFYKGTDVVELTDDTFHKALSESGTPFFVEFYAPWCGHCKALKADWIDLARRLSGKVGVAAVDCTVSKQTCAEFGIQGFPTINWFATGESQAEAYQGARDAGALEAFALARWAATAPPPEVKELVDQHTWEEACVGHPAEEDAGVPELKAKQLCVIAFLPDILDSGVAGRNDAIEALKTLAEKFKDRPFSFLWAAGGSQPALEANFGIGGYGYPALVAVNPAKGKFSSLRSAFEAANVLEFINSVRTGQERVEPVTGALAALTTTDPWDGKEGVLEVEEEFSLEDLMGKEEL